MMRARDVLTVVALTIGTLVLLPVLGPFAVLAWTGGVIALWLTDVWTLPEKVVATLVWPGGLAMPLIVGLLAARTCLTSVTEVAATSVGAHSADQGSAASVVCTGYALPSAVGIPVFALMLLAPLVVGVMLLKRAKQHVSLTE